MLPTLSASIRPEIGFLILEDCAFDKECDRAFEDCSNIDARNKDLFIFTDRIAAACDNLYLCTDDGSAGFKGVGTAMLEKLVAEGHEYTKAVAIGPMIMMKFATVACKKLGIPIDVSLNTLMVDGTGMCGACRVTVLGRGSQRYAHEASGHCLAERECP